MMKSFAFVALFGQPSESVHLRKPHGEQLSVFAVHSYKNDCGLRIPMSLAAAKVSVGAESPGSGMEPDSIRPYKKVLKDSFFPVECVADFMFKHGDNFGDNKDQYLVGGLTNTSIVHYAAHIAKEDREEMTHQVCFHFCRTVPDMTYFGIKNGRDCYCTPFYKPMSDDSSVCDAVCDGEPTSFCGGKSKSSMFGMHSCDNTAEQLATIEGKVSELDATMVDLNGTVSETAEGMQKAAEAWQAMLGQAGDPGASDLMQTAIEFAGILERAAGGASKTLATMDSLQKSATGLKGADLTVSATMVEAEELMKNMEEAATEGAAAVEEMQRMVALAVPNITHGLDNASKAYYPVMYFVDKEFESVPSTCTGTAAERPMIATMDSCARACDEDVKDCVGFSYYPVVDDDQVNGLCFLMSKFKTVKYWTNCTGDDGDDADVESDPLDDAGKVVKEIQSEENGPPFGPGGPGGWFLQRRAATGKVDALSVKCMAKLSNFNGVSLKPDASGKCDLCLKEAAKQGRCFN